MCVYEGITLVIHAKIFTHQMFAKQLIPHIIYSLTLEIKNNIDNENF